MPDYGYNYSSSSEESDSDEEPDRRVRFTIAKEISDIKYDSEDEEMPKKSCLKK